MTLATNVVDDSATNAGEQSPVIQTEWDLISTAARLLAMALDTTPAHETRRIRQSLEIAQRITAAAKEQKVKKPFGQRTIRRYIDPKFAREISDELDAKIRENIERRNQAVNADPQADTTPETEAE